MTALEQTPAQIKEITAAISASAREMVETAETAHKQISTVTGKMRDGTEKLGVAMAKFAQITNNADFAKTAQNAESLVNSLERLAALQESGMLDKVMAAMSKSA